MEKRAFKRIPVNIDLTLFYIDDLYSGVAQNVSEKGVYFSTPEVYLPHGSLVELIIPEKERLLSVHVRVNRLSLKTEDTVHLCMGAEVLIPSKEYFDFVSSCMQAA
jgi:hypothetical protein